MERNEFLKKGFGSLLGVTAIGSLVGAFNREATNPASSCVVTDSETEGPFPTKAPANFVIRDIRADRTGIPLTMNIAINNINRNCAPLTGAMVDVWQCDKDGYYSEYGGFGMQTVDLTKVDFLRGRQVTDSKGVVSFTSIFPGWYRGRAPHIHVHVYNSAGKSLLVTQIAFDYGLTNLIYTTAQSQGYTKGPQDTRNERDMVFADSLANEMGVIAGSLETGYTLTHTIAVTA